jgi:hypothetical protein
MNKKVLSVALFTLTITSTFGALIYDHKNLGEVNKLQLSETTTKALQYEVIFHVVTII